VIELPIVVRNKALNVGAHAWLEGLDDLVATIAAEWGLRLGRTFPDATEAFVAEVTTGNGTPAVLKLLVPRADDAARHEITVLRLTNGDGCVRLLHADEPAGALLLERLGPSLHDLAIAFDRRLDILADTAARVWRPAAGSALPTGADKGRWLIDYVTRTWNDLDRPCSERAVDYALACADRRTAAHDDERAVLVHGDVHEWNALQAEAGAAYKLIDPDGLLAEAEYDLGVLMREDPVDLVRSGEPFARARRLAARTGMDAVAIWEWGAIERVSTGLLCTAIGLQPIGRQMLDAAETAPDAGAS
jgi:streptomycin 6-kinase